MSMLDTTSAVKVSFNCLQHAHDACHGAYISHTITPVYVREQAMWSLPLSNGPRLLLIRSCIRGMSSHRMDEHITDTITGMCVGVIAVVCKQHSTF